MSLDIWLEISACPHCGHAEDGWQGNITHNLNKMAVKAGIYEALWRPETLVAEGEPVVGHDLIPLLIEGLDWLQENPERAKEYNPSNGWGKYEGLVEFVKEYLMALKHDPSAVVYTSR